MEGVVCGQMTTKAKLVTATPFQEVPLGWIKVFKFSQSQTHTCVCVLQHVPTKNSLIVNQVKVDHSYRRPDTQQGQHDEPGEEAAATGLRVGLLPILVRRLAFSTIWKDNTRDVSFPLHTQYIEIEVHWP